MEKPKNSLGEDRSSTSPAMSLGLQWAAGMAVCTAIGHHVDQKRGGGSTFTLLGVFAGLVYGAYELWKVVRKINERDRADKDGHR